MKNIGIMQGRLSDKPNQPLQSFPLSDWKKEFKLASLIGFDQIEWLIDGNNDDINPITSLSGQQEILKISNKYNISIKSLCAHSLICGDLLHDDNMIVENEKRRLSQILSWALAINIEFVIIPVMDLMSIKNNNAKEKLKVILQEVASTKHLKILLESDLEASLLKEFIEEVEIDNIGILYDLGNATAMGFDIEKEIRLLHNEIWEVHIKDRYTNNGSSVRLGFADTPFKLAIDTLNDLSWQGSLILETPIFTDSCSEGRSNFNFINQLVNS